MLPEQTSLLLASRLQLMIMLSCVISAIVFISLVTSEASAHFFGGTTLTIDKYQVTFVPYPETPVAGNNSTTQLNFSVLENNTNIYNIQSALIIAKADSGKVIVQYPYKLYELSDVTIPYSFNEPGNYIITLQSRIIGDPKYQATPLEASFDLSISSPFQAILSDRITLFFLIVIPILVVGSVTYLYVLKKY